MRTLYSLSYSIVNSLWKIVPSDKCTMYVHLGLGVTFSFNDYDSIHVTMTTHVLFY